MIRSLLKWTIYAFAALTGLAVVLVVAVIFLARGACVVLPNGYLLGYDAIFARDMFSISSMSLRYPDGRILVKGRRSVRLLRDAQDPRGIVMDYYGGQLKMPGDPMMSLIWKPDFFGREWYEPKKTNPNDLGIIHTDLYLIYKELIGQPGIDNARCSPPLFSWGA